MANGQDYEAYKLTPATTLEDGQYYVLTYHDKGDLEKPEDISDDVLYIFPINEGAETGACVVLSVDDFYQQNGATVDYDASTGDFKSFYLSDNELEYYSGSFIYDMTNGRTLSAPAATKDALGIEATYDWKILWSDWGTPTPILSDEDAKISAGTATSTKMQTFNWTFALQNGKYAVYLDYEFSNYVRDSISGCRALHFDAGKVKYEASELSDADKTDFVPYYDFTIFTIAKTTGDSVEDGGNIFVPSQNFLPTSITETFDPSKYVFESITTNGVPSYKLSPLANYNLNSGRGTKVSELDHAVKLYRATNYNAQLTLSNSAIGDWFGDVLDTNSGGVVVSQIGTTDINYTIPTGMIAFYIDEEVTNAQKPSYINIIVAVNPNQTTNGRIGLWNTGVKKDTTQWNTTFNINNPTYYFDLPVSKAATSQNDKQYTITVSEYYKPDAEQRKDAQGNLMFDDKGRPIYTPEQGNRYVYLGGQAALVYHSFEVTEGGIYLLGSGVGPMTVAYFSVSGAAGQGADGTSTSPLGDIDFVYAYGGNIISVDQKFDGVQIPDDETYSYYYPSYHFIVMKGNGDSKPFVQSESIKVHRYINANDSMGTKRHIKIIGCTNAEAKGLSTMYQDDLEE